MSGPPPGQPPLDGFEGVDDDLAELLGARIRPVNWLTLTAEEAVQEWEDLDGWVDWVRHGYGLPAAVIPPCWHLHSELVWELSALQRAWLLAYDPQREASGPLLWHKQFDDARNRLREWTATAGCKRDLHRPTRATSWPGEPETPTPEEETIANRRDSFRAHVRRDVQTRTPQPATN